LDIKAFHDRYGGGGSRKIARKLHEDVAFRVLAADNFPAHRTIREFSAPHLQEFTELFTQVVRLARVMGLVKLGTIAVDGTKIKANASRHKVMSYGRMQSTELELKAQIDALIKKATHADEAETNEPDLDIPAEIERKQARLASANSVCHPPNPRKTSPTLNPGS
jgi:hypothetical protein